MKKLWNDGNLPGACPAKKSRKEKRKQKIDNRGDDGDMFKPGDEFNDETVPDSRWWDGSQSGFDLRNIKFLDDGKISFDINTREL